MRSDDLDFNNATSVKLKLRLETFEMPTSFDWHFHNILRRYPPGGSKPPGGFEFLPTAKVGFKQDQNEKVLRRGGISARGA
jgi:hypothetical protein